MISAQLVSIIVMFISGLIVGAAIDLIRTTFLSFNIYRLVFLLEWTLWLIMGLFTFYLLFLVKGGHWRVADPLAQITGIIAYELLFQKIFRLIGRVLVNSILKPFYFVGHVFVYSVRWIIIILVKVIKKILRPIYRFFYKKMSIIFRKSR